MTEGTITGMLSPTIRLAEEKDKESILYLLNSVFKAQQRTDTVRGEQYWNWKFTVSPFGKSVLTVAEVNNEIIGVDNLWPWEFRIRGNVCKAYQPCDSVVHPKARGQNIFKNMRLHGLEVIKEHSPAFLYNFPNNQSLNVNLSLGWFSMGRIPWMVRVIRPLNFLIGMHSNKTTIPVRIDDSYDLNIDLLESLEKVNLHDGRHIRTHKKRGYFDWRYLQHPSRHYGMIYLEREGFTLAAIFTVNIRGSHKEMFIVELIGNKEITYDLIKKAVIVAKKIGADILALMQNYSFEMDNLWKLGFIKKKAKNMVVLPLNSESGLVVKRYENWDLCACLHDSI